MYLYTSVSSIFELFRENLDFEYLNLPGQDNTLTNRYYIYDPNLTFDDRLHKRLAYMKYDDRQDPFICAMWNMSTVNAITEQSRKFRGYVTDPSAGISSGYVVKFLATQLNLCFVSNSPEYLVDFEEQFAVTFDRSFSINPIYEIPINYQSLGSIINANTVSKIFTVNGNSSIIAVGDAISIFGSTGNDGHYTIANISFTLATTLITVNETVHSAVAGGTLFKNNGTLEIQSSIFCRDIEFNQIDKLDTTSRGEFTFLTISINLNYPVLTLIKNTGSNQYGKIIKFINFRTKAVNDVSHVTASDMILPYDEIDIQ